jgi:hypothetical protein
MGTVDVNVVARVLDEISDVLPKEELMVQRTLPRISPADALDTALKRSLATLRYDLNRETFEFLRWKVAQTRADTERLRGARHDARSSRRVAEVLAAAAASTPVLPASPARDRRPRLSVESARAIATARPTAFRSYHDEHGLLWAVTELATGAEDSRRARCLVFTSEDSVSCLWTYPVYWVDLSDGLLEALRRQG